ncbi:MAG: hypothetical protein QFC55_00325 [Chloroflexota bacterium]|nr:hypothetical protein [Chloroflexota bacterium]
MDALARDYLLVALGIGELEEGIVDAYYGPPELRQQAADANQSAAVMAGHAAALRARLADATDDEQRRRWLDRQLVGLETIANRLAGVELPYVDEVTRCFDARPEATPPEEYARVRTDLEQLLPGSGDLRERLAQHDARMVIPPDRLAAIADWVFAQLRAAAAQRWPLPQGESCTFSMVRDQPWAAYNWYDGNLQSRIEINTDLPMRADQLPGVVAHETFPGHHLEHAWHEQRLYRERGYAEVGVQLINTPEAYMSEGLGETGAWLLNDAARWQALLLEICDRAGIALSPEDAQREWRIATAKHRLRGVSGDAALQLFVAKRSREDVQRFLEQDALATPARAAKSLEFIEHPLWRTYVFCYAGGERLLTKWVTSAADESAKDARFFRLLTEQLTPSGIAAEITY